MKLIFPAVLLLFTICIIRSVDALKNAKSNEQSLISQLHTNIREIQNKFSEQEKKFNKIHSNMMSNISENCNEVADLTSSFFKNIKTDIVEAEKLAGKLESEFKSKPSTAVETVKCFADEFPLDCTEAKAQNITSLVDGITFIRRLPTPEYDGCAKEARCDQETDGGGWTVILARQQQDPQLDFKQDWQTYEEGFGDPTGEYWIGLSPLHLLTHNRRYELMVEMSLPGESAVSYYSNFGVDGPRTNYRLTVGGYQANISTGGDSLSYHSNSEFTTIDQDNDQASGGSCSYWCGGGGWWYNYCYEANPTGLYPGPGVNRSTTASDAYLEWRTWQGYYAYLTNFTMKIRRVE